MADLIRGLDTKTPPKDVGGSLEKVFGPMYNYSDELLAPSQLGVRRDGSVDAIIGAAAAASYYVDAIGFGQKSAVTNVLGGRDQSPMGVRYFIKTGQQCSNGADMYEYVDTTPPGLTPNKGSCGGVAGGEPVQVLPARVGAEVKNSLGVDLRGLAPGIMSDAMGALNPMPMFYSVRDGGYPECVKCTQPVGDMNGRIIGQAPGAKPWINDPVQTGPDGKASQTRWVFKKYLSQDEWDKTPKTQGPSLEGFANYGHHSRLAGGMLFAGLCLALIATVATRS